MVNLPNIAPIATELAPVNHLVTNNNGNCRVKPRKRMANAGFVRSDRWSKIHGYSYTTVNKYRGVLYGAEMFLPATPSTNGRMRIANEVANRLREHGVRPRHSEAKRPSCTPKRVNQPASIPSSEGMTKLVVRLAKDLEGMKQLIVVGVASHGLGAVLEMLVEAEKAISAEELVCDDCRNDLPCSIEEHAAG